jgi:hypothetical protein
MHRASPFLRVARQPRPGLDSCCSRSPRSFARSTRATRSSAWTTTAAGSLYKGTATLTGGTGRYRRITGRNITFTGQGPVSAKQVRITLVGKVRY